MAVFALFGRFARGRAKVEDAIRAAGHTVAPSFTKNVNILVIGTKGRKPSAHTLNEARQRGVQVRDEFELPLLFSPGKRIHDFRLGPIALRHTISVGTTSKGQVTTPKRPTSRVSASSPTRYKGNVYMYMAASRKAMVRARDYINELYIAPKVGGSRGAELNDLLKVVVNEADKQDNLSRFYNLNGDDSSTTAKRAYNQVERLVEKDREENDPSRMFRPNLAVRASIWIGTALHYQVRALRAARRLENKQILSAVEKWLASTRRQSNALYNWHEIYKTLRTTSESVVEGSTKRSCYWIYKRRSNPSSML